MKCVDCEHNKTCFRDKTIICPDPLPAMAQAIRQRLLQADILNETSVGVKNNQ